MTQNNDNNKQNDKINNEKIHVKESFSAIIHSALENKGIFSQKELKTLKKLLKDNPEN
ncbi:MAG: hypothetical protein PHV37_10040 [Candidatus Gastranaerophilales bacterium]|nr:hypothetical protein [Candidatus Gastranaerophilales bacterium]